VLCTCKRCSIIRSKKKEGDAENQNPKLLSSALYSVSSPLLSLHNLLPIDGEQVLMVAVQDSIRLGSRADLGAGAR
jgi:hypothetical protein